MREEGATRDILRCALRVTPQQATILETLYRRRRHVMPQSLAVRLDRIDHATEPSLFGVKVQVCNLRKTLGRDVIESKPHRNYFEGYRLTPKGRALIEAALGETA